jgi:hypothetical protein
MRRCWRFLFTETPGGHGALALVAASGFWLAGLSDASPRFAWWCGSVASLACFVGVYFLAVTVDIWRTGDRKWWR